MRKYILIAVLALFTACRNNIAYMQFFPIPTKEWHMDSVMRFDYTITDTTTDYRVLIYVRHTEYYPYQNMWLFVRDSLTCDTIEFYLADDRGRWLGDKEHGFIEMPVLYEETKHFARTGAQHLEIAHGMRDSLLSGVTDVGVEIITVKEEN